MSFDATRQVWAMRRAQRLPGGTTLLVLLAMADRAQRESGVVSVSVRLIGTEIDLAHSSVVGAIRVGMSAGVIELLKPGAPRRAALYRFTGDTVAPPTINRDHSVGPANEKAPHTVAPENVSYPQSVAPETEEGPFSVGSWSSGRPYLRARATISAREGDQLPDQYPVPPGPTRSVERPSAVALALMVGVEMRIEERRGSTRRPDALAHTIERRLAGTFGTRLAGMVAEGLSPERAAAAALAEDGVGGLCPLEGCRATDAKPITDEARCPRRRSCPFFVGDHDPPEEVLL